MKTTKVSHLFRAAWVVAAITFSLAVRAQAQTESVLLSFSGSGGANPSSTLIFDSSGHLYGTTRAGGNLADCEGLGCGVVFKVTHTSGGTWKETVIHNFTGGRDGSTPQAGLVQDSAGNLYGTTEYGGGACSFEPTIKCGVAFELSPGTGGGWKETVLHVFTGGVDGGNPAGGLILDSAGNAYGVTNDGGDASVCVVDGRTGCGVVFRLSPLVGGGWKETVLYTFTDASDGANPAGNLTLDATGNLYGVAGFGSSGYGVVYELSPTSTAPWTQSLLHTFTGAPDGAYPAAGLAFDPAGNLYGTTYSGGNGGGIGSGIVFQLSPSGGSWSETILYNFDLVPNGASPLDGVTLDASGNLYGTTSGGGPSKHEYGVVFEVSPGSGGTWTEKTLYDFRAGTGDGQYPYGGLVLDAAGNLYGTTNAGGSALEGSVFEITP
jgi:uncharacterized repeat protein (TIGR03803 family)